MTKSGAALFAETLEAYDVTHVFGNPGTTELPLLDELSRSDLEYVLGLHEDVAVGMAAGYAKERLAHAARDPESGINPVGVVNLHVAPGLAHGLGNLFDSSRVGSSAPLVVTAGDHPTDHQFHEPNLGADLVEMADQFTKWSAEIKDVGAMPTMLRRAFRVALAPPTGPVFLSIPFDVMFAETDATPQRMGSVPNAGLGDPEAVERAADVLAEADEPVLVVGDGVARAGAGAVDAAVSLAEAAGARVHGELKLSEVSFPVGHDLWAGKLPRDQERVAEMLEADTLVVVGTVSNTPSRPVEVDFYPEEATAIHVSADPWEVGKNYPVDVGVVGDPGLVMADLAGRIEGRVDDDELDRRIEAALEGKERLGTAGVGGDPAPRGPPVTNARFADALATAAPDARIVAEASTTAGSLWDAWEFGAGDFSRQRGGGLGYGVSSAIGTAIAEGETDSPRDVVCVSGDGAFLYYPQALYSAVRHDVDITVVVADNRNYRVLKENMAGIMGGEVEDYEFVGTDFEPAIDLTANAESLGVSARFVEDTDDLEGAVEEAVAESGPTLLDVPLEP